MAYRSTFLAAGNQINMKEIEKKVEKAKRDKKIFMILGGHEIVRQCLISRGWIEKMTDHRLSLMKPGTEQSLLALKARDLPHHFIMQPKSRPVPNFGSVVPYVNTVIRRPPMNFTDKDGLENIARSYRWFHQDDLTGLSCQRAHIVVDKASRDEFSQDFLRTAFTSFLFFLHEHDDFEALFSTSDKAIPTDCIDFACQKIDLLIKIENHADIDSSNLFDITSRAPKKQDEFLTQIRQIKNGTKKFIWKSTSACEALQAKIAERVAKILEQWPFMKYDGYRNVWIMKPLGHSCGNGVIVMNNEENILKETKVSSSKFLVQKYVEKPLLIHRRKFDMRIYFMTFIRDGFVDVWFYRDCYIKFSTPVFTLDNFHRSIHLTNYTVQKYFMNATDVVPNALENMWPLAELLKHFESIGMPNVWHNQVLPGIKKNLLTAISASLEGTIMTPNNFELNGADFMIGYDFEPIFIEINSAPALYLSQVQLDMITRRLLEDIVRVVVDRQRDPEALTGDFELIHSFEVPNVANEILDVSVIGKRVGTLNAKIRSHTADEKQKIDSKVNTKTMQWLKDRNQVYSIYYRENVSA